MRNLIPSLLIGGKNKTNIKKGRWWMPLRLAKGKLKSEHCTCVQHLLTHRRHSRTCLAILDSPDNDESCSVLWRGQLFVGSFFAVRKARQSWRLPSANASLQSLSGLPWGLTAEIPLPSAPATHGSRQGWSLHTLLELRLCGGTETVPPEVKKQWCGKGTVPSRSMCPKPWRMHSQMCKARKKILYQVIKEK